MLRALWCLLATTEECAQLVTLVTMLRVRVPLLLATAAANSKAGFLGDDAACWSFIFGSGMFKAGFIDDDASRAVLRHSGSGTRQVDFDEIHSGSESSTRGCTTRFSPKDMAMTS